MYFFFIKKSKLDKSWEAGEQTSEKNSSVASASGFTSGSCLGFPSTIDYNRL